MNQVGSIKFKSPFAILVFLFILGIFGTPKVWALSNASQQSFAVVTAGPVTSPDSTNWSLASSPGSTYTLNASVTNASVTFDPFDAIYPQDYAYIQASGAYPGAALTLTYTDPSPTAPSAKYVQVDVFTTSAVGKHFTLLVTDTNSNTAVTSTGDILTGCLSPPATITGSSSPHNWSTVFIDISSLPQPATISTVQLIMPVGQASDLNTNFVYADNLTDAASIKCIVPPTPTFTWTPTLTATFTDTSTFTSTITNTLSPTNTETITTTFTPTPTFSSTNTPTITDTPTVTSTNTPTVSPTPTLSPLPSNTYTYTVTSTNSPTPTYTPSLTSTYTYTVTPTNSSTPSDTPSLTSTYTPGSTSTSTNTWTQTFTSTASFTPTPSYTSTITFTPTNTLTFTITLTPTITNTPPPTSTPTDTPCPVNVYPNPMDYQHNPAFNNQCPSSNPCIKFSCIPPQSTLSLYTITLSLVRSFGPYDPNYTYNPSTSTGLITWDGKNGDGNPVAAGFYFYKVDGPNGQTFGKFAISRSLNGP